MRHIQFVSKLILKSLKGKPHLYSATDTHIAATATV